MRKPASKPALTFADHGREGAKQRIANYYARLAEIGITPQEMRRINNLKRVQRFRAKKLQERAA